MSLAATHKTINAVWRIESAKVIATVARMVRDVGLAEELAQDALVAALDHWPADGVPNNPGAWLMTTAKNRALDRLRQDALHARKHEELGADLDALEAHVAPDFVDSLDAARVPFEVPQADARAQRLASVLEVIYLVFNEGYAATAGDDWMRPALCDEAVRLGRVLAGLLPDESEVHGLVALMEIQASRTAARVDAQGHPVLLMEQDRARWDTLLVRRGLAALAHSEALGGARGPYALQAALAACHARATTAAATDWPQIVALYDALAQVAPSPVVELNRAVAVGMAFDPAVALEIVDELISDPSLASYHWLPSVRGDLLAKLGRLDEARAEFERAAGMTRNRQERALLLARARKAQH